jgi:hypothetical protein
MSGECDKSPTTSSLLVLVKHPKRSRVTIAVFRVGRFLVAEASRDLVAIASMPAATIRSAAGA